jgi:hypothetical protein
VLEALSREEALLLVLRGDTSAAVVVVAPSPIVGVDCGLSEKEIDKRPVLEFTDPRPPEELEAWWSRPGEFWAT